MYAVPLLVIIIMRLLVNGVNGVTANFCCELYRLHKAFHGFALFIADMLHRLNNVLLDNYVKQFLLCLCCVFVRVVPQWPRSL